jgi:cytochrome c peroxidase
VASRTGVASFAKACASNAMPGASNPFELLAGARADGKPRKKAAVKEVAKQAAASPRAAPPPPPPPPRPASPPPPRVPEVPQWTAVAPGAAAPRSSAKKAFDAYLKGNHQALSAQAKQGLKTFIDTGCAGCHSGVTVGGQSFQKFGITQDYWLVTGSTEKEAFKGYDKGRFQDTKNEADAFMFKVSQLRNVAMTPPYFHDGSVATLPQAVRVMAQLQLGKQLSDTQVADIVSFLESLTGEVPADFAKAPALPVASH